MLLGINISFDLTALLMYLSGILTGFVLAGLIYVLLVLLSINKSKKIIEAENNINEEELRIMIDNAKENFKLLKKSKDKTVKENAYKDIVMSLVNDIAKKCFPNSKKPLLELSIDESILLIKYITKRIEDLLNKKGLSLIKRLSIAKISTLIIAKKKIDDNVVVKEVKKYSKIAKVGMTVANIFMAPVKLVKTGYSFVKNYLISKILLVTINIVGEETYKIYSKQAIKSMDPDYLELLAKLEELEEEEEKITIND